MDYYSTPLSLQFRKPIFTRDDKIGFYIFLVGALALEMMFLPFYASNMPLLDMSNPLPEISQPDITIVFNFAPNITINYTEDGVEGTVDPTIPIMVMMLGILFTALKRYYKWKKDNKQKTED